ncbi:MAG: hypothetical protein AAFW01_19660 [Pseudomonadota bacterium]
MVMTEACATANHRGHETAAFGLDARPFASAYVTLFAMRQRHDTIDAMQGATPLSASA